MNALLLLAHWGVGEVLIVIAILVLLFGDRQTWIRIQSAAQSITKRIQARRSKRDV